MIKLQFLLRHPAGLPGIDHQLRARLEGLGLRVTASGRASVSVEADAVTAERLFGPLPAVQSGFALLSAPALPVPPDLADDVSMISIAPQHAAPC